ncbi:MAG TPA: glutathione S-transferase family protein, partial [Kofleriaceae bacterium]
VVHWMLEELGIPYRIELMRMDRKAHKDPAFLAINPMGKVPALAHRGITVTETPAIVAYLADAFPAAELAPAMSDPARGTYYRWMFFGAGVLEPAMTDRLLGRPPSDQAGRLGYGTYDDTMNVLASVLSPGPFVLGERFSAIDVYFASQLGWGVMAKTLDPRPVFDAYLARCGERPAHQRFLRQAAEWNAKYAALQASSI